jgi:addiction module RelE/StbE family toxin
VRLKWTRAASQDLESVEQYISLANPDVAIDTVLEIIRRVETLAEHPGMGRPGRVEGTRELVLGSLPYVVPYVHQSDTIIILRFLHGAMRWPESF